MEMGLFFLMCLVHLIGLFRKSATVDFCALICGYVGVPLC